MLSETDSPQYLLRMGSHAERSYIDWMKPLFDALLLNANLVEGTPAASLSLVESLDNKPYVIDPISYAFALPVQYLQSTKINKKTGQETISVKRTFQKLAERYGEPFSKAVKTQASNACIGQPWALPDTLSGRVWMPHSPPHLLVPIQRPARSSGPEEMDVHGAHPSDR